MLIREAQHEIDKFAPIVANMQELQRRKELKNEIEMHRQGEKTSNNHHHRVCAPILC